MLKYILDIREHDVALGQQDSVRLVGGIATFTTDIVVGQTPIIRPFNRQQILPVGVQKL